ncbi:hypothetical protein B0T20DRAFT_478876 [Sordaria brevicollis]|uniref:Enoyl reductase (ER) domain-containing protein n=1 Tax=Sordaria brevicollis TaxID=83679 RepID=A0AAE0PGH4_SORBR|nr:hypothetical protein B0T20DRAFT_478876 [Sordaria brevicollis]
MRAWTLTSSGLTLSPSHPLPVSLPASTSVPFSATSSISTAPGTTATQPTPTLTGNNLLIHITHASLNPVDLHILRLFPSWLPFRRNPTPGFDFCGRVVGVGPGVSSAGDGEFQVGDVVAGALGVGDVFWGKGSLAEYLVVDGGLVGKVPNSWKTTGREGEEVKGEEAVGPFGIAGQTAVLMTQAAGVPDQEWKGKRVLVNGASGGVGSILVQILKGRGAEVWGTTGSQEGEDLVKKCGGVVINYKTHAPVTEYLAQLFGTEEGAEEGKLDYIFDCAGSQPLYTHSPSYLKPKGKFISIVGGASQGVVPYVRNKLRPVWLGGTPREFELLLLLPGSKTVREVGRLIEEGVITRGWVDGGRVWEMEELVEAYRRLASGRAKGKVVVRVSKEEEEEEEE